MIVGCSSNDNLSENVTIGAKSAFKYYSWSEENYGSWRGGGWHLLDADKNTEFSITKATKGTLPDKLKVAMSTGSTSYTGNIYCLNINPPLYFGYGDNMNEKIFTKNFLMFEDTNGEWKELGSVWNESWVRFIYPPDTYKVSTNFYMGVEKSMFEMMGCDNFQE